MRRGRLTENLVGYRFIRDGEDPKNVSWEERVARAYESKLFKEFALSVTCNILFGMLFR